MSSSPSEVCRCGHPRPDHVRRDRRLGERVETPDGPCALCADPDACPKWRAPAGPRGAKAAPVAEMETVKMLGSAPATVAARDAIDLVAPTTLSVLLEGQTGTGKEVAARRIHAGSSRAAGPFVAIDCASIASEVLESELFGHEAGAFTGAKKKKRGLLEVASGGTLFLDELGAMPPAQQQKLLRALESRQVRRVGAETPVSIDVRLIAATDEPGRIIPPLLYRVAQERVSLPTLVERLDDIAELFEAFAEATIAPAALALLRQHSWPGNVRELKNAALTIAELHLKGSKRRRVTAAHVERWAGRTGGWLQQSHRVAPAEPSGGSSRATPAPAEPSEVHVELRRLATALGASELAKRCDWGRGRARSYIAGAAVPDESHEAVARALGLRIELREENAT